MIKIFIFEKDGKIVGWQAKGHSGYADEGSDIVCASVSTAAEMGLEICLEAGAVVNADTKKGFMFVEILQGAEKVQIPLHAMVKMFENLEKQYGKFVKMEVKKDVF